MTEHLGEEGNTHVYAMVHVLVPIWVLFNISVLLPLYVFMSYTLVALLPAMAAASVPNTSNLDYIQVPLEDLESDVPSPLANPYPPIFLRPDLSLRPILRKLISRRTGTKYLAFFRGFGIFAFMSGVNILGSKVSGILADSSPFGGILALFVQISIPLALVQIDALWTQTILTHASEKPFRQRLLPFQSTLRATGLALAIATVVRMLITSAFQKLFGINLIEPIYNPYQPRKGFMLAAGQFVLNMVSMPVNMVLIRIQASLLPSDENTIFPLDDALKNDRPAGERRAVGMKEACASLGWGGWRRLGVLYAQAAVLAMVFGGALIWAHFRVTLFLVKLSNGTLGS